MDQNQQQKKLKEAIELHNKGYIQSAEKLYREILMVNSSNKYALNYLSCILRAKEQYIQAIKNLEKAIFMDPSYVSAYFHLGHNHKDYYHEHNFQTHF